MSDLHLLRADADAVLGPVQLPGLDPLRTYTVRLRHELDDPPTPAPGLGPALQLNEGLNLSGAALATSGVALPLLRPASGVLLDVRAIPAAAGGAPEAATMRTCS